MSETRRFAKLYTSELKALSQKEFTVTMLVALAIMRGWANYNTGVVPAVSASRLSTATRNQISAEAFTEALRRLAQMGYIASHRVIGQKGSYRATLHNFEITEWTQDNPPQMFTTTINEKKLLTWKDTRRQRKGQKIQSDEAGDNQSEEAGDEFPPGESKQESSTSSENEIQSDEPGDIQSEEADITRTNRSSSQERLGRA